jgi:hypothetical protein
MKFNSSSVHVQGYGRPLLKNKVFCVYLFDQWEQSLNIPSALLALMNSRVDQ